MMPLNTPPEPIKCRHEADTIQKTRLFHAVNTRSIGYQLKKIFEVDIITSPSAMARIGLRGRIRLSIQLSIHEADTRKQWGQVLQTE